MKKIKTKIKTFLFRLALYSSFIFVMAFLLDLTIIEIYKFVENPIPQYVVPTISVPRKATTTPKVEKPISVKEQILAIAEDENFKWKDYLLKLLACESSLNPKAINVNSNGTKDKGIAQINDIHKLPDSCVFDVDCSVRWTIKKISAGKQSLWICDQKIKDNPQKYAKLVENL